MTSSDGSFAAPEIGPPVLVLRAAFEGEPRARAELAVVLRRRRHRRTGRARGGAERRGVPRRRRPSARCCVASTTCRSPGPASGCRHDATSPRPGSPVSTPSRSRPRRCPSSRTPTAVRVERIGEAADYREVGDELAIGVSTTESETGTDWFDLGITITVEGRRDPVRGRVHRPAPGATPTSCCPTAPTSRSRSRSWSRCAR